MTGPEHGIAADGTFVGGVRTIAHWENALLTEACGGPALADGLAHPIHLFHVPIEGAGVSIAGLFAHARAEGPDRVGLAGYDWEWFEPLREATLYYCSGGVQSLTPKPDTGSSRAETGVPHDELVFTIDMATEPSGPPVARVTNTWHIWRTDARPAHLVSAGAGLVPGPDVDRALDRLEPWVMSEVSAARMRTTAAILRDPNPVHWDLDVAVGRGHPNLVNQGPLNVGYLINLLHAWQGEGCVRRLSVEFPGRVFAGDRIEAHGTVTRGFDGDGEGDAAEVEVWLERSDGTRPVVGKADVIPRHP